MIRRAFVAAVMMLMAAPAYAQLRFEAGFLAGYTFAEGVTGDLVNTPSGTFNTIDVKSGGSLGLSFGLVWDNGGEVGFMWSRHISAVSLSGFDSREVGDLNIDSYHGYFGYNFRPLYKVRPYVLIGFGATAYGDVAYENFLGQPGSISGLSRFSATIGAGVKAWANDYIGFRGGMVWTPTYITSDAVGWWCDPYWGCYLVGDSKYANQFQFQGGVTFRFGGR